MIEIQTLSNGVRLITEQIPFFRSAALGFFAGAGTRDETPEENGAAHFIEHMLFKGTESRSAARIAEEMDFMGGMFNACTAKEQTCFYTHCLDEHLGRAIDLLGDMLFCSRFDQEDTELERGVILEEIEMYEDTPEDLVSERLCAAVFRGAPLARPVLGTEETLAPMTGDFLRDWQKRHYLGGNMVVCLTGSFSQSHIDQLIRLLLNLEPGTLPAPARTVWRPAVTVKTKPIEQNHLLLAYPALSYMDSRRQAEMVLCSILGGGSSSRLFQLLREQLGLCYNVYSFTAEHEETGFLGLYAAVSSDQEEQCLDAMRRVVSELAEHGPSEEEVYRVRELAKASLVMSLESLSARCQQAGNAVLLQGRLETMDRLIELYDAVTREQVRDLAQEIFRPDRAAFSAVGQLRAPETYLKWLDCPEAVIFDSGGES